MFRTTAILIAASASILAAAVPVVDDSEIVAKSVGSIELVTEPPATPEPATPPTVVVPPLTSYQQGLVDWARGRFARAGLELPETAVRFDPSRERCRNAEGRYEFDGVKHLVTICTRDSDSFAAELERKRTLLHEFGHAWDTANLTDEDRDHLAEILGAESWYEGEAWADRGVERFAEAVVFNLLDQPARHLKLALECDVLLDTFEAATGAGPQGPGLPTCGS